jgi:hypothetical protein
MSRSDYCNDGDNWGLIRWRGAVNSAIKGRRGQQFLRDLRDAMDSMQEKELIADELEFQGQFCALGAVGHARGIDLRKIDPDDSWHVSKVFGIANALAREIVYMNDEGVYFEETPEQRFARMRTWADEQIETDVCGIE